MCSALCSKQVLHWKDSEHPHLEKINKSIGLSRFELDTCSFCLRFCEAACPRLESAPRLKPLAQISARAIGSLSGGEPNDVVCNLLIAARAAALIDGALMIDADRAGKTRARIVTSAGSIAETTGFQYVWTPVLDALNEAVFELGLKRLAVVSTPCTSQAIRLLMGSKEKRLEPYQQAIQLSIAIFCTSVFKPEGFQELLAQYTNFSPEHVRRFTAYPREGKMRAQLWDGSKYEMELTTAEAYTRAGCARCDDYLGESADIAVGTVGAVGGSSTMIVRSPIGQVIVQNAAMMKLIETQDKTDKAALERASAEKDRRARAQAFDELQMVMLDALHDPQKRSQVKLQFDLLYGRTRTIVRKEDYRNAGCGDCSGC